MTSDSTRPTRADHMQRLAQWILCHRLLVCITLLIITATAGYILSHAHLGSSLGKLFFGDSPNYQRYVEYSRTFGSDQVLVVGIEDAAPLAPETLDRLETAVAAIEALPNPAPPTEGVPLPPAIEDDFGDFDDFDVGSSEGDGATGIVKRVDSVLNAQRVRRVGDALESHSYADLARAQPDRRDALQKMMANDGLAGGILVSEDGKHTAVGIVFYSEMDLPAEYWSEIVDGVEAALIEAGFPAESLHLAGLPAMNRALVDITIDSFKFIFPASTVLLIFSVLLLFRRFWPAIAAASVSLMALTWTMALAVLIDREISVMHTIAPVVILIVGAADVIHLCSAYLLELRGGKDKHEAIVSATAEVGEACLFTSVTTLIGFLGLTFVPTPVFQQLGITLGTGVAFALLIAVFFVPILLSILPTPKATETARDDRVSDLLDRSLDGMADLTQERPRAVIAGFILFAGLIGYGLSQLQIETAVSDRLDPEHVHSQDRRWLEDRFVGSDFMQLIVDAQTPGALFTPEVLNGLAAAQALLEENPSVDSAGSVVDLFAMLHTQLTGEAKGFPETRAAIAQYALPLENLSRSVLDSLVDFERQRAVVHLRLNHDRVRELALFGLDAARLIEEKTGGAVKVEPTGMIYLTGDWLDDLVAGQQRGLGFTFFFIGLMMIVCLRSLRAGLWSMVPNALPLFALGGYLGLTLDSADSDVLVLAMLAIGIGVDDTIHFLMRFRLEHSRTDDTREAVRRTFHYAGRAIVVTTIVLGLGFLPLALSGQMTIAMMGTLLPLTLVVALVADLLLVPALARVGLIRFPTRSA